MNKGVDDNNKYLLLKYQIMCSLQFFFFILQEVFDSFYQHQQSLI